MTSQRVSSTEDVRDEPGTPTPYSPMTWYIGFKPAGSPQRSWPADEVLQPSSSDPLST